MRSVLKSLMVHPSQKKWLDYNTHFRPFFSERDDLYDASIEFIQDFLQEFDSFPTLEAVHTELVASNDQKLVKYLSDLLGDPTIKAVEGDIDFAAECSAQRKITLEIDLQNAVNTFRTKLSTQQGTTPAEVIAETDLLITSLHTIKGRALRADTSNSMLLYGDQALEDIAEAYRRIVDKARSDIALYYTIGFDHFEPIQIKQGDLVFFGGFTSHGKSVFLRYLSYRLMVDYGLNVAFWSFEMKADVVRMLFIIMHANNKAIFPNTPHVKYEDFKHGALTPEVEDFVFRVVAPDFMKNVNYGTLYIDQPNKSRYTLLDLGQKLKELESNLMPVHGVALDYLTMMYPQISERASPQQSDYNQMIKDFKNMALTHRNAAGLASPFIAMTAAQISRAGYEAAMKNNGIYEITAFAQYSEIERSSDQLFSTLMTAEMRDTNQIRLQNHKNRDGQVITDPLNLYVDLAGGFGLSEIAERNQEEVVNALQSLNI